MKLAVVNGVGGKYTYPAGSGTQFNDAESRIYADGFRGVKAYSACSYATDYPLQTSWSSTPTSIKTLLQTTQFNTMLTRGWTHVMLTWFSFANGITNWCRVEPSSAKMQAEYDERVEAASYLLSHLNGLGVDIRIQNWEGDWAFMDSFTVNTRVDHKMIGRYVKFFGICQKAIADARRDTPSDCKISFALEVNRVLDARLYPHRRRLVRDVLKRFRPDVVSYSAYDSTIVDQGGWGADLTAWTAATTPAYTRALRVIKSVAPPHAKVQVGEVGFPEGAELPPGRDVAPMIQVLYDISVAEGVDLLAYWNGFDNEETSPGVPRGFYTVKPDGSTSVAGAKLISLL